jgi:hypothetical protein
MMYAARKAMMSSGGSDFLEVDNPNLIVYYGSALDTGALDDLTGGTLDAELTGTVAGAGNGRIYNGVSEKAFVDADWDTLLGTAWTFSFFVEKKTEFSSGSLVSVVTDNTTNTNNQINLHADSSTTIKMFVRNTALDLVELTTGLVVADGLTHFTLERNGSDWEFYKDNILVDSTTVSFGDTSLTRFVLGAIYSDAGNIFTSFSNVDLGQVRVYNIKVNDAERTELFSEGA